MSKKRKRFELPTTPPPTPTTTPPPPFGFDISAFLKNIKVPEPIGHKTHNIQNNIVKFENGQPVFNNNKWIYSVQNPTGMYAMFNGQRDFISNFHTNHTVSLYAMAHSLLATLTHDIIIDTKETSVYRQIDISQATIKKRTNSTIYLNAKHRGRTVFLKTTDNDAIKLKYVIEAVIHRLLKLSSPGCVPSLEFVGMTPENHLVICSEQLQIPSISTFVQTLGARNKSIRLRKMLLKVCRAFIIIQRDAKFTHRDCHTGNVYYDESRQKIQFIDFDWSCICHDTSVISVPRFLYDTTRRMYGHNKSVDMCVFMRNLGKTVRGAPEFISQIWEPLMQRYEDETRNMVERFRQQIDLTDSRVDYNKAWIKKYPKSKKFTENENQVLLKKKQQQEHDLMCAMQLYKMSSEKKSLKSEYAHKYGLGRFKNNFDYYMGYFEWESMTPRVIEKFISKIKI